MVTYVISPIHFTWDKLDFKSVAEHAFNFMCLVCFCQIELTVVVS